MPVNSEHPEYKARLAQWVRCDDCVEGSDAVKAAGEEYLPRLEGQMDTLLGAKEYSAYKTRALFYNATSRTVDGLAGLVFRKDTQIEMPLGKTEQATFLSDITQTGVTFDSFAKNVVRAMLTAGRVGILVDRPIAVANETQGDPFLTLYDARDIINWQMDRRAGKIQLTRLVLREAAADPNPADPFEPIHLLQYRELFLDNDGVYTQQVWREKESTDDQGRKSSEWVKYGAPIIPTMRDKPFDFIPFTVANVSSIQMNVEKAPLLDLVDVNLSHYRSSADLEHARHYTALPTPWVAGFDTSTTLKIGSGTAWVSDNPDATAGILEFQGSGLSECRNALEDKQKMMAVLGARLLEEQKTAVEAADTIKTRTSGEQSIMRSLVATASEALQRALNWMMAWQGLKETVKVELNQDFIDTRLDPTEQQTLMLAYQAGTISFETYYWNLNRGEMTRPGVTAEQEKALIDAERVDDLAAKADEASAVQDITGGAAGNG
jgi:hypothetical protein